MKFSYQVNEKYLIRSAILPVFGGEICLITGVENASFSILGGIIAKLFPVNEKLEWPHLQALIENYTGKLTLEDGSLPNSTVYVGVDPDRHLLFSTVREEMLAQTGYFSDKNKILSTFGLDSSFLGRHISSLSGGEKMKVALAIAFSSSAECYVLHGVIPWLDKKGRGLLIEKIIEAKNKGSQVFLLEHENYPLRKVVNKIFEFDGSTVYKIDDKMFYSRYLRDAQLEKSAQDLAVALHSSQNSKTILEFNKVTLRSHPYSESKRTEPLLDQITFYLNEQSIYFLVGNNGAGKSTIAQLAFKVLKPDSGSVVFCGELLSNYSRRELIDLICYVGQFPERQITLGTIGQYRIKAQEENNAESLMLINKFLNLPDSFLISSLSYLQMKLLGLSTFVTKNTKLIILDEPTWGIDKWGQQAIFDILRQISGFSNYALLIISHDLRFIRELNAKILFINNGDLLIFDSFDKFASNRTILSEFDLPNR